MTKGGKDEQGRTRLHIGVLRKTGAKLAFGKDVNYNVQELESGYTALHMAMLQGELRSAIQLLPHTDQTLKDKEGLCAIDLLYLSIKMPKIQTTPPSISLWAWGSNINYSLGKHGSVSIKHPERIHLMTHIDFSLARISAFEFDISMVSMSKYHTCLIIAGELYTIGFGKGGRLGLGNHEIAHMPSLVNLKSKVVHVSCGPDHTIAITKSGQLWSWGCNEHKVLGYKRVGNFQLVPEMVSSFKGAVICGSACSKYHSVCFSAAGSLYTWGTDNGQLGFSGDQLTPRKVTLFPQGEIISVSASDTCTAMLLPGQVHVISNGVISRLMFPLTPPKANFSRRKYLIDIPKNIVQGNGVFASVFASGDVYLWQSGVSPKRVWSVRKKHLAAIDCAVGVEGCLLIATSSGRVYFGARKRESYKFTHLVKLSHIVKVRTSPSGAFMAVRSDLRPEMIVAEDHPAIGEIQQELNIDIVDGNVEFAVSDFKWKCHAIVLASKSAIFRQCLVDNFPLPSLISSAVVFKDNVFSFLSVCAEAVSAFRFFLHTGRFKSFSSEYVQDELKMLIAEFKCEHHSPVINIPELHNVWILCDSMKIGCHAYYLAKVAMFKPILERKSAWALDGTLTIDLSHISHAVFGVVLEYIYGNALLNLELMVFKSMQEFIIFVMQIFKAAKELMMDGLATDISNLAIRTLSVKNIMEVLDASIVFQDADLQQACCDFGISVSNLAIWNLPTLIQNGKLVNAPDYVTFALEMRVKELRVLKSPNLFGDEGFYARLSSYAEPCKKSDSSFSFETLNHDSFVGNDATLIGSSASNAIISNSIPDMDALALASPTLAAESPQLTPVEREELFEEVFHLEMEETKASKKSKKKSWKSFSPIVSPALGPLKWNCSPSSNSFKFKDIVEVELGHKINASSMPFLRIDSRTVPSDAVAAQETLSPLKIGRMSQKDRRRLISLAAACSPVDSPQPSLPDSPWKVPSTPPLRRQSFLDIQKEEELFIAPELQSQSSLLAQKYGFI